MSSMKCIIASLMLLTAFTPSLLSQTMPDSVAPPASPPVPDCFTALLTMSDCLTFVEQGSNLTQPDKPCCSELAGLVDTNPVCLCRLLGKDGSFGVQIDMSRAMKLPDVCQVSTPTVSLCAAAGAPVGGPDSASPSPSPTGSYDTAETLNPSTVNNENGASSFKATSAPLFLIGTSLLLVRLIL